MLEGCLDDTWKLTNGFEVLAGDSRNLLRRRIKKQCQVQLFFICLIIGRAIPPARSLKRMESWVN
jgi:hypothetical protein